MSEMTGKGKGTSVAASSIGIPAGLPGFEGLSVATYPILESLKPSWLKTIEKELSDVQDKNLELCDLVSDEKDKNKELEKENYTLKVYPRRWLACDVRKLHIEKYTYLPQHQSPQDTLIMIVIRIYICGTP